MTKIAYLYNGNNEYLDKLIQYEPVVILKNENDLPYVLNYNLTIKMINYDSECYDIVISDTDEFENLLAIKKVAIGKFENKKKRIQYIEKFNIEEIFKKPKKKDYKFSIIVPNYNNGDWINKTIESVLNQTYTNWEMYIIDDISTDNSIEVINKYYLDLVDKGKNFELIQNKIKLYNGGSRNIGILKAKNSNPDGYLLFIDSDDWLANDKVLEMLNNFIEDEDLITLDYQYYMANKIQPAGKCTYKNKDDLFMTIGCMCAVWCKCFKVSIAPLFEFNTLMEDRNYHYRLINKISTYANLGQVTHTWNKCNFKSVTTTKDQQYKSELQAPIEWDNCAYRHIAGMLDLLNELNNPKYIDFIKRRIDKCKNDINMEIYQQY